MLKRFRRHLNPPMVVSTIALFAALGGGYAMAFSGTGTLQKAGETGLPGDNTTFETIRSLTGIGSIQATCNETTDQVTVRFRNTSGEQLRVDQVDYGSGDGTPGFNYPTSGENVPHDNDVTLLDVLRWYVHPTNGSKTPQAEIMIGTEEENGGDAGTRCQRAQVYVLALNTQQ